MLKLSTFPRFSSEQQSKAKMAAEIEELKRDYEDKLKEVTDHKMTLQTKDIQAIHNDFKDKHYKDKDGKVPDYENPRFEKKFTFDHKVNERAKTASESRKVLWKSVFVLLKTSPPSL